jgi:uncharacterized YigZ family protein
LSYLEPVNSVSEEIVIKKSRFIAIAKKVVTRDEAMAFINELKESYPDARHHCWAYLLGDPLNSTNCGSNDDGEPSGTAGRPILSQINYSNIGNIVVVIVRYFGGIRLGAGGLVRAYRESAQKALKALEVEEHIPCVEISLVCPFSEENNLRKIITFFQAEILEMSYSSNVKLTVIFPEDFLTQLQQEINNVPIEMIEES